MVTDFRPSIKHGFTPGSSNNPFADDHCMVLLARYPCPWPREEHDPALPPEDVDCFGRRRLREAVPPPDRSWATMQPIVEARLGHHPGIAESRQIAAQPMRLTPKRLLWLALREALALLDAETEAHAKTKAHLAAAMGQTGRRC